MLDLPLAPEGDYELAAEGWRLRYRAQPARGGMRYGAYVLAGPVERPGEPVLFTLRFQPGMSAEPMFFSPEPRRDPTELAPLRPRPATGGPLIAGVARVVDASHNRYPDDTGRWSVEAVY